MARDTKPSSRAAGPSRPSAAPNAAGKKMGSLSSFQPLLNFSSMPSSSAAIKPKVNGSSTSSAKDRERMPPPVAGTTGRRIRGFGPSMDVNEPPLGGPVSTIRGKGGSANPIEFGSSGEDEPQGVAHKLAGSTEIWTDVYGPTSIGDLAPGKNRVAFVKNWLHEALYGYPVDYVPPPGGPTQAAVDKNRKYKRILLLTGPAGIGKTTSVKVIAQELGVELVEWAEGIEERSLGFGFDRESPIAKLSTFLSRHAFAPLSIGSQGSSSGKVKKARPRVLLMTALPNLSHLPTKEAFHSALFDFCQHYSSDSCPLIIVHSDSGFGGRAEESWMEKERGGREGALDVLGAAVKNSVYCQEQSFISVAPTFMTKALNRVLALAVPDATRRPPTSALQLIALTSNGDLRSAINSLQLLCSGQGKKRKKWANDIAGGAKKKGKGSRGGKGAKLDVSEDLRAVLDAVTRREQSLSLFHALGKVLYNKRLGDPKIEGEDAELVAQIRALPADEDLPAHLRDFERSKSLVQMETFLPTVPVDASSFALWIHQSLPLYCGEVEETAMALDDLCGADIMRTDDDFWQSSPQAIAYALHLSIRGTQMALPSPVPRNNQKIIKPQFFQSYRDERDNGGRLDTAAGYIAKKAVAVSIKLSEMPLRSEQAEGAWGGVPSRTTLSADLIPMMIKIQSLSGTALLPVSVKDLAMKPYYAIGNVAKELRIDDEVNDEPGYDDDGAGEDGLGHASASVWDEAAELAGEGEGEEVMEEDIDQWD